MNCLFCSKSFEQKHSWQKYCDSRCRGRQVVLRVKKWRSDNKIKYAESRVGQYKRWTQEKRLISLETAKKYGKTLRGKLTRLNLHVKHRGQSNLLISYNDFIDKFGDKDWFCAECKTVDDLTFDHIKPFIHNGEHRIENLQILCRRCNSIKGCYERYSKSQNRSDGR